MGDWLGALKFGFLVQQSIENLKNGAIVNTLKKVRRIASPGYSFNNPVVAAFDDAKVAMINRGFRALGLPDNIGLSNKDVTDIPDSLKEVLRLLILTQNKPKGVIRGKDWRNYQGTYTGGNRSILERIGSPSGAIEHTMGQFSYYTDENGDVHAVDTYDFNVGERTANNGLYSFIRDVAGLVNSRSTDPDFQKRHYDINLGNRKTWK